MNGLMVLIGLTIVFLMLSFSGLMDSMFREIKLSMEKHPAYESNYENFKRYHPTHGRDQ